MHKRFPELKNSKKVWAAAPWANYVIKVAGVYIAFDDADDAYEYADDTPLESYGREHRIDRRNHGKAHQAA